MLVQLIKNDETEMKPTLIFVLQIVIVFDMEFNLGSWCFTSIDNLIFIVNMVFFK